MYQEILKWNGEVMYYFKKTLCGIHAWFHEVSSAGRERPLRCRLAAEKHAVCFATCESGLSSEPPLRD
jgi:hypothetical protein